MSIRAAADVVIVGGGVFGLESALAIRARGASVLVLDPGPVPHPDAASTDISKLVRADYGKDVFYTELMEAAFPLWRTMNERFGETVFHETGFLVLTREEMREGGFEHDSFALLTSRGHALERLDARTISAFFPAWREGVHQDGYVNPVGGWAESGRVVRALLREAVRVGVVIREGARVRPIDSDSARLTHVTLEDGEQIDAGMVVVAAGAFTPSIVPELSDRLTPVGQSVMHFDVADSPRFSPPAFLPWASDIARTGWYGFTHHAGVVKIANHGRGVLTNPRGPRVIPAGAEAKFRAFFTEALPALATAPCVATRLCLYCDSFDGDFLIDRHPTREGLIVAAGGSGHAFKFAPILGDFVADRVEGKGRGAWTERFRWRSRGEAKLEAARAPGD